MEAVRLDRAFRVLLAAVLALAAPGCGAQDWVRSADRGGNRLVIEAMQSGSLQEAVEAARSLGERADPFVSDVVSALLENGRHLLVQFLLHEVFPPAADPDVIRSKLAANPQVLDRLAAGLANFGPALRRETVRLFRVSGLGAHDVQVFALAAELERRMREQEGHLEAEEGELALEVLEYAASRGDPDFLDPVLRLQEASRDRPVARKAAAVARKMVQHR